MNMVPLKIKQWSEALRGLIPGGALNQANATRVAEELVVSDQASLDEAAEVFRGLKDLEKQVDSVLEPIQKSAYDAYDRIKEFRKSQTASIKEAYTMVKGKMEQYQRRVAEEQRRIEEEKARLYREEAERIRKAREEEARRRADEAAKSQPEGTAIEAHTAVEAVPPPPIPIPEPPADLPVVRSVAQVKGGYTATLTSVEVLDLQTLCAAIGAGAVPTSVVEVRPAQLKEWALKQPDGAELPGIRIVREEKLRIRA